MDTKKTPSIATEIANGMLTMTFSHGKILTITPDMLSSEAALYAPLHGLKQKLGDAAALARNEETGRSATIDEKYDAVKAVFDRITSPGGTWNMTKTAGNGTSGGNLLIRALMKMYPHKTRLDIEGYLENKTKDERAALRKNPTIAAIIVEMQAATIDKAIDTSALLDELA